MHPELFKIPLPGFLEHWFNTDHLTVHTYGFCIALGIIAGYLYTYRQAKKQFGVDQDTMTSLLLILVISAIVGGKFFFYLEDPAYYFSKPIRMIRHFSGGFVFYGSLLFAIPAMLIFFKKKKLPILPMLDIFAITAPLVHAFGRLGCLNAGCCHGLPTNSWIGIVFTDPQCAARPLNTPLYPTQIFSIIMLLLIIAILLYIKPRKKFDGQLFLIYLFLYAIGRSIIEIYRGDYERGFIIEGILSHSQFISLFVLAGVIYFYRKLSLKSKSH